MLEGQTEALEKFLFSDDGLVAERWCRLKKHEKKRDCRGPRGGDSSECGRHIPTHGLSR